MSDTDLELLKRYTRDHAEDAFAELVRRHVNLVHSAALRHVRFPQLAEEVAQSTFTDLARNAQRLAPDTILTAWLYQVTRRTAIDVVRREARRQLREQIATELNVMNATTTDWTHIEPLLDDAMSALDETDRTAVLLRYFENKSLREVDDTLGTSDDAAQKRVSRAVERLREFFAKRGVTVGASGLAVVISANAVQAAPVGLALTISTAAALIGTTLATTATATATKAIAMTTLQKAVITGAVALLSGASIYEAHQASNLRTQIQLLQQQQIPLAGQVEQFQHNLGEMTSRLDLLTYENEQLKRNASELLRLRAQISELRSREKEIGKQNEQKIASLSASQTNAPRFSHSFLTKATCLNVGLDTVDNALQTYLWALNTDDEPALAQISTKDDKGNPKKLTGLSLDFEQKLIGVQPLTAYADTIKGAKLPRSVEDISSIRFELLAEVLGETDAGPRLSHIPLTLRFKKEGVSWKFDGNR
jgi:RNA polymerase sigma factor (sigma-70 family)